MVLIGLNQQRSKNVCFHPNIYEHVIDLIQSRARQNDGKAFDRMVCASATNTL